MCLWRLNIGNFCNSFKEVFDQYILANALAGTSGAIRIRTMRNMSPRAALLLKEDLEDREARSIEEIMEAQHLVLQIIKQLKEEGEI